MTTEELRQLADNDHMLEVGRQAIENALVQYRDGRISELGRGNGLVIREKDGCHSDVIRFGPEQALRIGLRAMAVELQRIEST